MQVAPRPTLGVAYVVVAAIVWGTTGTLQALAGGSLPSLWFGTLRLVFAALFFIVFATAKGGLTRRACQNLPPMVAFGAGLCMAVYNLAFFAGVKLIGVGVGNAIAIGSGPIWAGLLQAMFRRQPPATAWWVITLVAITWGVMLSAGSGVQSLSALGIVLCLTSGLSYAVYTSLNKRMVGQAPASSITLAASAVAALLALPAAALQGGWPAFQARDLLAAAYTGIVTAGVGYLLFSFALHHIRPATAVTLALTEPVMAFMLAVLLLGEPTSMTAISGLALVAACVLGVVRSELSSLRGSSDMQRLKAPKH